MEFRASISKATIVHFTLEDLIDPNPPFSIRHLVKPWMQKGNIPDRCLEVKDADGIEIYEHDIVQAINYPGKAEVIYNDDQEAGACFWPQFDDDETVDWWENKERWHELRVIDNSSKTN